MPRRQSSTKSTLVPHPRYGAAPHTSGLAVAEEAIRRGHWTLRDAHIYPESVLVPDTALQNYAVFPRRYYVDVRRVCASCSRPFIFFAKEQRYWYETLRFYVDADCIHCPDCRRQSRTVHRRLRRYSDMVHRSDLSADDLNQVVGDAVFLFNGGVLKNFTTLGALKNRALKTIPHYANTEALVDALHQAQRVQSGA